MPFEIIRNDITRMTVDAIVNTANPDPVVGSGTDSGIHAAAGPRLLEARKAIGKLRTGEAAITPGFDLPAQYVIHTVGPVWRGGFLSEAKLLRKCYDNALNLALKSGCSSIAFPLIATGNYRFPKDKALQIAIDAFRTFLDHHEMTIYLVVFSRDTVHLSERLFHHVSSYIDEHYVARKTKAEYALDASAAPVSRIDRESLQNTALLSPPDQQPERRERTLKASKQAAKESCAMLSLEEMLRQEDAGFSETLLRLIDRTGKKDSQIYTRANISRQHFSKIRNNPSYQPTKQTALAFAIALELTLEETKDLIGRAGYTLTRSSKFDLIIMYFIGNGIYDLFQINAALFEFDQSLLGA